MTPAAWESASETATLLDGAVRARARREADLFLIDLYRHPRSRSTPPAAARAPASEAQQAPVPPFDAEAEPVDWSPWLAELAPPHRRAYAQAQRAHLVLPAEDVDGLALDLLAVRDELEMEAFFDDVAHRLKRATSRLPQARGRFDPGAVASQLAGAPPLGDLARAAYGAAAATARGQSVGVGALDGLVKSPLLSSLARLDPGVTRADALAAGAKLLVKAGVKDVRAATQLAGMVAPFVPGAGSGVAAALGAASALAAGQPITAALASSVRSALPGGPVVQSAFDTAARLSSGSGRVDHRLLAAARDQLPAGGARAAFDAGVAIAQAKRLQDRPASPAIRALPPSRFASSPMQFAQRVMAGADVGRAALSPAGNALVGRVTQQGGDLLAVVGGGGADVAARIGAAGPSPGAARDRPPPDHDDFLGSLAPPAGGPDRGDGFFGDLLPTNDGGPV